MNSEGKNKIFCKKIKFKSNTFGLDSKPTILLGLVQSEDKDFLMFQTARTTYRISKRGILSIEDTKEEFIEEEQ